MRGKRSQVRDEIQQRILDASMEVFSATSFDRASIREIARRSGVGVSVVYDHFPGKRELIVGIITNRLVELNNVMQRDVQGIDDPVEKINKLTWSILDFFCRNRRFSSMLHFGLETIFYEEPEAWAAAQVQGKVLSGIIEEGKARGVFRDDVNPDVVIYIYFGALKRIMSRSVIRNWESDWAEQAQQISRLILNGMTSA